MLRNIHEQFKNRISAGFFEGSWLLAWVISITLPLSFFVPLQTKFQLIHIALVLFIMGYSTIFFSSIRYNSAVLITSLIFFVLALFSLFIELTAANYPTSNSLKYLYLIGVASFISLFNLNRYQAFSFALLVIAFFAVLLVLLDFNLVLFALINWDATADVRWYLEAFGYSNGLGLILALAIIIFVHRIDLVELSFAEILLYGLCICLCTSGLVATKSLGGLLSLFFGVGCLIFNKFKSNFLAITFIMGTSIIVLAVTALFLNSIPQMIQLPSYEAIGNGRIETWAYAFSKIFASPISFIFGLQNTEWSLLLPYRAPITNAHSVPINIALQFGFLGLLLASYAWLKCLVSITKCKDQRERSLKFCIWVTLTVSFLIDDHLLSTHLGVILIYFATNCICRPTTFKHVGD